MTDDKPMISSEIEITPAPAIMFSAAAKRTSGVIASRSGGWTRNCTSVTRGATSSHPCGSSFCGGRGVPLLTSYELL